LWYPKRVKEEDEERSIGLPDVPKGNYRQHQSAVKFQVQQRYLSSQILLCKAGIVGTITGLNDYGHIFELDDAED
jgi:hypothetical protein